MNHSAPAQAIEHVRLKMRRAVIRHELQSVAAGKQGTLSLGLDERGIDVAQSVTQFTRHLPPHSVEMGRIVAAFERSGIAYAAIDGLASSNVRHRITSARMVGALRMEKAIPWLSMLLASGQPALVEPAARTLGRVGGWRSAEILVAGIRRSGPRRVLVTELARAAPDLFLEVGLSRAEKPTVINALAIAAGLRRRHAAVGPLTALLLAGTRAQRAISCRSLGWIGARTAIPLITDALSDYEWRVRISAAKALAALDARESAHKIAALRWDHNLRVRKAALSALRRFGANWTTLWL